MSSFSSRFRDAMRLRRIKAPELARLSTVSQPYIYDLLMGRAKNPSVEKITALAQALDVNTGWLLTGDGDAPTGTSGRLMQESPEYTVGSDLNSAARIAIQALTQFATREQIAKVAAEVIGFKDVTNDPQAASVVALLTTCAQKK